MMKLSVSSHILKLQRLLLPSNTQISKLIRNASVELLPNRRIKSKSSWLRLAQHRRLSVGTITSSFPEERSDQAFIEKQGPSAKKRSCERNGGTENDIRVKILEAALSHVPAVGFTRKAIEQGAEEAGFSSLLHGMFPEGGFALVSYFYGKCNNELIKHLQNEAEFRQTEVSDSLDFLVRAIRIRLEMIIPYKAQWPQAISLIAMPRNAPTALAQVLTLVDDICYYSGDRSVDFDWYTRRVGLATILKITELYMMQDTSPQHSKTWDFLKNRMEDAMQLQMMLSQTGDMTQSFQRSFNSAFLTARNILGLGYNRS